MSAVTIQQMAGRVADLMTEKMGIKGRDLAEKLNRAGRRLPGNVRVAAQALVVAEAQSHHHKLMLQIDDAAIAENYDICIRHLTGYDRWEKRKSALLGLATSVFFSLLVVVGLFLAVLKWRGLL